MRWWKLLGVAAFVGVAATGVLIARHERHHRDYTPEEIRDRLHARAAEAFAAVGETFEAPGRSDDAERQAPDDAGPPS